MVIGSRRETPISVASARLAAERRRARTRGAELVRLGERLPSERLARDARREARSFSILELVPACEPGAWVSSTRSTRTRRGPQRLPGPQPPRRAGADNDGALRLVGVDYDLSASTAAPKP